MRKNARIRQQYPRGRHPRNLESFQFSSSNVVNTTFVQAFVNQPLASQYLQHPQWKFKVWLVQIRLKVGVGIVLQHPLFIKKSRTDFIQGNKSPQKRFGPRHKVLGCDGLYLGIEATKGKTHGYDVDISISFQTKFDRGGKKLKGWERRFWVFRQLLQW